jgi:hypothetical protein
MPCVRGLRTCRDWVAGSAWDTLVPVAVEGRAGCGWLVLGWSSGHEGTAARFHRRETRARQRNHPSIPRWHQDRWPILPQSRESSRAARRSRRSSAGARRAWPASWTATGRHRPAAGCRPTSAARLTKSWRCFLLRAGDGLVPLLLGRLNGATGEDGSRLL